MQIKITHYGDSIDPNASYDEETFNAVVADLEKRYTDALLRQYPQADIQFAWSDRVGDGIECSDPDEIDTVRETCVLDKDWSMDKLYTNLAYWITYNRLMEQLREDATQVSEQIDDKRDALQDNEDAIDLLDELSSAIGDLT